MRTVRWTVRDLDLFPDPVDDTRYEIIAGELQVAHQPHWRHQLVVARAIVALGSWSDQTGAGFVFDAPGMIFSEEDAVAPDLVWVSADRVGSVAGDDGKLHLAPDLVVEVLSPGRANETRDREVKLDVYGRYGVQEYWVMGWEMRSVDVFRLRDRQLELAAALISEDVLVSPMLPGFALPLSRLFAAPV